MCVCVKEIKCMNLRYTTMWSVVCYVNNMNDGDEHVSVSYKEQKIKQSWLYDCTMCIHMLAWPNNNTIKNHITAYTTHTHTNVVYQKQWEEDSWKYIQIMNHIENRFIDYNIPYILCTVYAFVFVLVFSLHQHILRILKIIVFFFNFGQFSNQTNKIGRK